MRTFDYYCPCCRKYIEITSGPTESIDHKTCPTCKCPVTRAWITPPQINVAFMPKKTQDVAGYDPRYVDQPEDRDARKEQLWYLNQWHRTGTGGLSDGEYAHLKKNIEQDIEKNPAPPREGT